MSEVTTESLFDAISSGNVEEVAALIAAGADVRYQTEGKSDALINACYGRDVLRDTRLIELLTLLIEHGAPLRGRSTYNETAVRVLSNRGRFDAVEFLLKAGANSDDVEYTQLIEAVAFGSLANVEAVVRTGANLEEREYWERTAWLVAIQTGDIPKARFLLERGTDRNATGRCGKPPLFYAIENRHSPMLAWLLQIGIDVQQTDKFGDTALATAAQYDNVEAIDLLLQAGADVNQETSTGSALRYADTREVAMKLLEAGADPQELSREGRRAILGLAPEPDADLLLVTQEAYRAFRTRRFGTQNPELMTNPFWESMIRSGLTAYSAVMHMPATHDAEPAEWPTWCADRFGQSLTFLEDGRIVQIAGEHEDGYDPEFCIYNDVFVHDTAGNITIYGYPEVVFPPTDFHTATLIGKYIYVIGSLGYEGTRQFGETPVYRLNIDTFEMECLSTTGDKPGWVYKHRAVLINPMEIQVTGGKIGKSPQAGGHVNNSAKFVLNIENLLWTSSEHENS